MPRLPNKQKKGKKKGKKGSSSTREVQMTDASTAQQAAPAPRPSVWRPGVDNIEDGEELQFDPSAYDCLHAFRLNWPCLSFDIVRDNLGDDRKAFPQTLFLVTGTQASSTGDNVISAIRLANITQMKQRRRATGDDDEEDDDSSDSSSSSDEEEEEGEEGAGVERPHKPGKPIMQVRSVSHHGAVNRIRSMPQQPAVCAAWSDAGRVQVWDLSQQLRALENGLNPASTAPPAVARQAPLQLFAGHQDEGYAVDWSAVTAGRLATGDCKGAIYRWEPSDSGRWAVDAAPLAGHQGSVEDLQWSPTEPNVLASCGVDGSVCVWDVRMAGGRTGPAVRIAAHSTDVNVISWNKLASCMIASGCDDGSFRIWDLRLVPSTPTPDAPAGGGAAGNQQPAATVAVDDDAAIAHFKHHSAAITSIEWSPHESSSLVTSSADNQICIWDLALERDAEEEAEFEQSQNQPQAEAPTDLPPQLLFVHQGQRDIKEVHWHPQIRGMLVSTALDGFNAFRPSNM